VGLHRRVPPTEAARLKYISRMNSIAAPVKILKGFAAQKNHPTCPPTVMRHGAIAV
jgi:hypothetical protein